MPASDAGHPAGKASKAVPLRARLYALVFAVPTVLRYNAYNVAEQSALFLAVGALSGIASRWSLDELREKGILTQNDPIGFILLPVFVLFLVWLVQERFALWGTTLRDPLTKPTRWDNLISKLFHINIRDGVLRDASEDKSNEAVTKESLTTVTLPTGPPKREFTPVQEASISALVQKFFNPNDSNMWTKSRFLCVDDNGRWAAIRALDARKWKVDQASLLIENNLRWREKDKIDDIFSKVLPLEDVLAVRSALGDGFFGLDRTGAPIYWCPAGSVFLSSLRGNVSMENIVAVHVQLMEYNQRVWFKELSRAQNRCVYQSTCVLDLKGFSARNTAGGFMECMQAITSVDKDFYYENLFRVYILHAPLFFRFFWQSVSQLLQPETREKFVFLPNVKALHKYIDPKIIPKQFGGEYAGSEALFKAEFGKTWHSSRMDTFLMEWRDGKHRPEAISKSPSTASLKPTVRAGL